MSIQQYMGVIKATFCIVLVLNFVSAAASIEEKKTTQEEILSQLFVPASELLDYDTAEVLWMTCLEELIHLKRQIGDFGLCLPQESPSNTIKISLGVGSITRENIQKCIITCHPELEENFLQCLRKNNVPFHVSPEEGESENCLGSLSSRRYLADNGGSATKSNADKKSTKKKSSKNTTMKRKDHKKALYDAIAKTALITFVAATLLFLCCCCCCRRRRVKQTDERPLLSMSINSDYSHGSSSGNTPFKNSLKEEKHGIQPPSNNLVGDKNSVQGNHVGVANTAARPSFELKPPPGRAGSGIPPLKPPPGRPDSLQRESQSVKPSDNSTALPPPLPPPAPPIATNDGPKPPPPPPKPGSSGPKPPPPSPPGAKSGGPGPPPPPKGGVGPPRAPPAFGQKGARPLASAPKVGDSSESEADAPKAKLKPFFWDKVQANSDQSMVWNQLKAGSFQFDEEMMESLFGLSAPPSAADKNKGGQKKEASPHDPSPQFIQIVDKKKAQNLSILLRALNVTLDEVCDALLEGNEFPTEFLQTMLKMAPTPEEELKLRLYSGDILKLGPADRFLKALVDIPFAFKRMEALLYMGSLQEELTNTRESFATLEVACKVLRNSRLFLKLLEAVLKTGNRMNDGTFRGGALAFKLDTLLKLSDVKGVDGKTTLLHFVVQEIIRTEGIRSARMIKESSSFSSIKTEDLLEEVSQESEDHYRELGLQVVSHLSSELEDVKKAAALDSDGLTGTTARLGHGLIKTRDFIAKEMNNVEIDKGFVETVKSFVEKAEADVKSLLEEEKKIMALVKSTGDYFHGSSGRDEGLRLFVIVRDFLIMLDKVCKEIQRAPKKPAARTIKQETPSSRGSSSSETRPPHPDFRQRLFPVVADRRVDNSSSDEESP